MSIEINECELVSMFEAMYYPYTSIKNEQTLKRCLFYLDKIYFLIPYESLISSNRSDLVDYENESFGSTLFEGVSEDIIRNVFRTMIKPIDPQDIFFKHSDNFINSIKEDLSDKNFKEFCNEKEYWMLYNGKVPKILEIYFKDRVQEKQKENTKLKLVYKNGKIEFVDSFEYFLKVDRDFGESVLLNYVIYSCMYTKISPLTDEIEHNRALNYKINRNYEKYKNLLYEAGYIEDLKQQLLIKKVFEKHFFVIENVEMEDIINYREDHKNELKKFTVEMGKISNQIKSKPFDLEFESEISQIINDKIDPSIEELNTSMQDFKDEMVKKYMKKIAPIALTFAISAFSAGWEVGALSASVVSLIQSVTHKDGTELVGTLLDHWHQNRRYERNSLHYLINAEKEFNIT
jgi:hypothetical protein